MSSPNVIHTTFNGYIHVVRQQGYPRPYLSVKDDVGGHIAHVSFKSKESVEEFITQLRATLEE